MAIKPYQSKKWLTRKFYYERLTEQQIADLCGASQATIHRWLTKFGLIKDR